MHDCYTSLYAHYVAHKVSKLSVTDSQWARYKKNLLIVPYNRWNIPPQTMCMHMWPRYFVGRNDGIPLRFLLTQRESFPSFTYSTHCRGLPQCPYDKWIRWSASFHLIMCFSVQSCEWIIELNANEHRKSWLVPNEFQPARLCFVYSGWYKKMWVQREEIMSGALAQWARHRLLRFLKNWFLTSILRAVSE